jgi:hypothetical protein
MIRMRFAISTAVILLLTFVWTSPSPRGDEPPPKKELTAEQKEKLKEHKKEMTARPRRTNNDAFTKMHA